MKSRVVMNRRTGKRMLFHGSIPIASGLSGNWPRYVAPLLIVVMTGIAFLPVLENDFVNLDDRPNLLENLNYRGLGWSQIWWMFTTFHNSLYRPLTWLTFSLDYSIWGMDPAGYHLTSLAFHCANAVLFYFLVIRLLHLALKAETTSELPLRAGATFASLLFALHPLRVEPVAWLSARNDLVSGLFFLCSILSYLNYAESSANRANRPLWYLLSIAVYILSLLAKGSGMSLAIVLLVLDVYPLRRLGVHPLTWFGKETWRVWTEKLPFIFLAAGAGAIAVIAKSDASLLYPDQYGFLGRMAQAVYGFGFYLWKTIVPVGLSPLYAFPVHFSPTYGPVLVSTCVFVAVSVGLFVARHRWPAPLASWVSYVIILAPVSGFVRFAPSIVADRYSYLACMGWAILAGASLDYLCRSWMSGRIRTGIFILSQGAAFFVVVALGAWTWNQTQIWHDSERLWRRALVINPESGFANYFLGILLTRPGDSTEAIQHFNRALVSIDRGYAAYADIHYNLARLLAQAGKQADAIEHYREALRVKPNDADTRNNFGLLLALRGEVQASLEEFQKAVQIDPTYARAYFNMGRIFARQGDLEKALINYEQAHKLNPNEMEIQLGLANVLAQQGNLEAATRHFQQAVNLKPEFADAHAALARLLAAQGRKNEAEGHYEEALRLMKAQNQIPATP